MQWVDEYPRHYQDCVWLDFTFLEGFMRDSLVAAGVPAPDAAVVADVLIESDRRGIDSHGIGRLKPIYIDRIRDGILDPVTRVEVVRDRKTVTVLDGHNGMGHVVAKRAMETTLAKARAHGMGMTAVRNSTHYGIAGYYASMAAKAGMIGITGTNARPSIAPTFGVENMLGTNPLTIGFPTDEDFPFILDCATSVTQRGKIESYARMGKDLVPGWVIDEEGRTRTDTAQVLVDLTLGKAALTPLGGIGEDMAGFKGYGYATVVEVLSAALQDGAYLKLLNGLDGAGNKVPIPIGHFFMAVDIEEFIELDRFKAIAGDILRELRASRKAPGEEHIFTAGEKEHLAWGIRKEKGCPVGAALRKDMETLRKWYDLPYHFPWDA
ncbi:Ldh family oxidoreductase [Mesoterricola silvestris]|uniref:Malate dehydrogenase n=1 Tax=Mesoterricola silvestris TaxID=2927979 RepID=A0AA48K806_9BACT|nr:Ldh family oxidoreductase [Mesoterricola silvestris]BDU72454.1 malate dehydrogenase [Mesoterricola silvestris]